MFTIFEWTTQGNDISIRKKKNKIKSTRDNIIFILNALKAKLYNY